MISRLRETLNTIRGNAIAARRKRTLAKNTDPKLVEHLKPNAQTAAIWYGSAYGGFYVNPDYLSRESIVYSFGIGKDITFDMTCIRKHGCHVHGFDPTPKSLEWIQSRKRDHRFHMHPYGISPGASGIMEFHLPANPRAVSGSLVSHQEVDKNQVERLMMKSFQDIMQETGHDHIDVLKMDIEGSEYEVLESIMKSGVPIRQLLVEFHDRLFEGEPKSASTVRLLEKHGFRIFASSISFEEISFVNTSYLR
jgi:FkbM family methyltransferase